MTVADGKWLQRFPELRELDPALIKSAKAITVDAGTPLFRSGEACRHYLLILEGEARVQKVSDNGQVITLYHLKPGQACELTTACLLGGRCYPADAVADTPIHAILIPKHSFQAALARCRRFRSAVFSAVDQRIHDLVALVEEVSFGAMDRRIARRLLQWVGNEGRLSVTHYRLAEELGTAREVVSRILKEFERNGWVRLHRGTIEIVDADGLRGLSDNLQE